MPTCRISGPLCADRLGVAWVDDSTLCRTRTYSPAVLGASAMDTAPAAAADTVDSGALWVARFPTGTAIEDCASPFRENLQAFVDTLGVAGARVSINATRRPAQRAYLMHWSWKLARQLVRPPAVPPHADVAINWAHCRAGVYSEADSLMAARAMVVGYGMSNLRVAPALRSNHIAGLAVDMNIDWSGTLAVRDAQGQTVRIASQPRDGMNAQLHEVGKSFGVIKYLGGASDRPHWSVDGR